jgi:ubiquinone/menaquinone biosynthesis methyltransferase
MSRFADQSEIYSPAYVEQLFERMSASYDRVNRITSFGFSTRWRRQCVQSLDLAPGMQVVDFLTGMGEAWPYILSGIGPEGHLTAIDFCPGMIQMAEQRRKQFSGYAIELFTEDALNCSLPDDSADAVVATFGLKTFSKIQIESFASEIWRLLKPGGQFSLVEISRPDNSLLAVPYMFYLKNVIPYLGKILLGDPDGYRMLGVYTENFKNCQSIKDRFERLGFELQLQNFFGGCASSLVGRKPA